MNKNGNKNTTIDVDIAVTPVKPIILNHLSTPILLKPKGWNKDRMKKIAKEDIAVTFQGLYLMGKDCFKISNMIIDL